MNSLWTCIELGCGIICQDLTGMRLHGNDWKTMRIRYDLLVSSYGSSSVTLPCPSPSSHRVILKSILLTLAAQFLIYTTGGESSRNLKASRCVSELPVLSRVFNLPTGHRIRRELCGLSIRLTLDILLVQLSNAILRASPGFLDNIAFTV